MSLSGAILQAEHKETVKQYVARLQLDADLGAKDMNSDSWTATDTIMGQNQLVIKTTGIGFKSQCLHVEVMACSQFGSTRRASNGNTSARTGWVERGRCLT